MSRFNKSEIEQAITSRFEQMVSQHSARLAVKMDGQQLTYSALNAASNRIGNELLQHQMHGQEPIAILMDQSTSMIASILGVLKAGQFYVSIDPTDPPAHIDNLLREAGIRTVLTNDLHLNAAQKAAGEDRQVINADAIDQNQVHENLNCKVSPDDNAYLFYTSGTTGKAKGVVDCHRNVLHNIMRYTNNLHINYNDKLTLLQDPSFSGSVSSLFGALLNGAAVYPFDVRQKGFDALADLLIYEDITMYHSVPSIFEQLMHTNRQFPRLRVIRLEGDRCDLRHHKLFQQHFTDSCILANGLGATETGLSHQNILTSGTNMKSSIVPVGHLTEDMEAVILDDSGLAAPQGQPGEIAIKSHYLAIGYWRNSVLTDKSFEKLPGDSRRQYLTGDLGRINSAGQLEVMGRKDFQVKIRSHRVDLDAIEHYLSSLPGVSRCLVRSHAGWLDHARLIAHVLFEPSSSEQPVSESWLRNQLCAQFPAYMIPSRFIPLTEIPLDRFGKVDRKNLPPANKSRPMIDQLYKQPLSGTEKAIAGIWQEMLYLNQVGLDDDFFELGGDSLLAMALPRLIKTKIGKRISDATLLEARTIRQLSRLLDDGDTPRCLVAIQPQGSKKPFFCVHAHTGRVLEYRDLADWLGNDQPFYGLQSKGAEGMTTPLSTIEAMASCYLKEIRQIQPQGPYQVGGYCFGAVIAFEMAKQLLEDEDQDDLIVLIDPDHPPGTSWQRNSQNSFLRRLIPHSIVQMFGRLRIRFKPTPGTPFTRDMDPILKIEWSDGLKDITATNLKAIATYRPRSYSGNIVLICVDSKDRDLRENHIAWKALVEGHLEIIRLPLLEDKSQYQHLFHAPYLTLLNAALKKLLGRHNRSA